MKPNEAQAILLLSSKPEWGVYVAYIESRLEKCRTRLEYKKDGDAAEERGQCKELRNIMKLREKAEQVLNGQSRQ